MKIPCSAFIQEHVDGKRPCSYFWKPRLLVPRKKGVCVCVCWGGKDGITNAPAGQETWVQSLGGEDPLEEGMATHSSVLAWRIPWTEEAWWLQSTGSQRVRHN